MDDQYTVTIQSLVYEGGGFSRLPSGKAVFVPFVMPGEEVVIRLREEKRGFALADLVRVEKPHPERIQPRCIHFGICGGCHYQHMPYDFQLESKKAILIEQLQRIAGMQNPVIDEVIPAPEMWNYRNAIQFQLSPQGRLCYVNAASNALFPVEECHLPMPAIADLWPQLTFEEDSFFGRLEIRQNQNDDLLLALEGLEGEIPELESESSISIVSLAEDDSVVLAGEDHLVMQIHGKPFCVSAGSFFQTNFAGAEALVKIVEKLVVEQKPKNMLDVYCGAGLFSAFLADKVEQLAGIESSPSACRDFAVNLDEFDNVSLYEGAAEQVLPGLDFKADGVVVDPPRAGLHRMAMQALLERHPDFIVYVSCNPATLARDTKKLMNAGYVAEKIILVDMFPQTYHMESIVLFRMKLI